MNKFLIVDGSNLLFQMFFGMPARIVNGAGKPIQGTLGFVGAFLRMVRMTRPTHAAVIFDGEHGTERNEISSDYKANRRDFTGLPDADSPFSQLDDICAALDLLGVFRTEAEVYEADDVIASYAIRLGGSGEYRVVVASQDSDLYQLIGENVSVLRYRGKKALSAMPGTSGSGSALRQSAMPISSRSPATRQTTFAACAEWVPRPQPH